MAPFFDDELWHFGRACNCLLVWMLREMPSASKRFKMVTLSLFRLIACNGTCAALLRIAGRRNCPVLPRKTLPGRTWPNGSHEAPTGLSSSGLRLRTGGAGFRRSTVPLANRVKEVDEDLASHATPCLKSTRIAERNSAGGEQRLKGGEHTGLDRELLDRSRSNLPTVDE
eukprot:5500387-Amphidinium_carterae.1